MARRRRAAPRRARRSAHGKTLKRVGLAVLIIIPLLYFAFTVVLYDPFEETEPPFPTLVPRDADFYVRRLELDADIGTFPVPHLVDRLQRSAAFRHLTGTGWWDELTWPEDLAALASEWGAQAEALPLDVMADILGDEVVVVGRMDAASGEPTWALMARISSATKLSIELLDFDFALAEALPGATMEEVQDPDVPVVAYRKLSKDGQPSIFFARKNDLLVVGADELLVRDVLRSVHGDSERSLGLSRLYRDGLPMATDPPEDHLSLELMVDLGAWWQRLAPPPAPVVSDGGTAHPDALANLLEALFDPDALKEAVARLDVKGGQLTLAAHAELIPAAGTSHPLRGSNSFAVDDRMAEMMAVLPTGVSGVVSLSVELRPFLHALTASFDPEVVKLMDTSVRDLAKYSTNWHVDSLDGLIAFLDRTWSSDITIAFRPIDHVVEEGTQPLPLMAFMIPLQAPDNWETLAQAVIYGHRSLGLDPDRMWQVDEGVGVRKWLELPAGGAVQEIAFIAMDWTARQKLLIVTTDSDFLREIVSVYTSGRPGLSEQAQARRWFGKDAEFAGARANVAAWIDADVLHGIIDSYADYVADDETWIDLGPRRATERALLLQQQYPDFVGSDELPVDIEEKLDRQLDEILGVLETKRRQQDMPAFAQAWRERHSWLELLDGAAGALRWGDRDAALELRLDTVLGGP